jgi:hypothetical protein
LRDIFRHDRILLRRERFEIGGFDVFHQQIQQATALSVLDVPDDSGMVLDFGEDFGAANETAAGDKIKPQAFVEPPQRKSFSISIGGQPNGRHAPGIDLLLKIKTAERGPGFGDFRFCSCVSHQLYVSRPARRRKRGDFLLQQVLSWLSLGRRRPSGEIPSKYAGETRRSQEGDMLRQ